jgi:hypothetical protein
VYYFGKKILKAWDQVYRLKIYKIIIGIIILLLVSNFAYCNYLEGKGIKSLCKCKNNFINSENQFAYSRFVGLII